MAAFTINNISGSTVSYQGQSILSGVSYTTPGISVNFAADSALWADVLQGNITITVNNFTFTGQSAVDMLRTLAGVITSTYRNITGNTTVTVKPSTGIIRGLSFNNGNTGGVVTLYDNTTASGTIIGTFQIGTPSGGLLSTTGLNSPNVIQLGVIIFSTGLTIVTSGSSNNDITVYYL